jgi:hypothetical protein
LVPDKKTEDIASGIKLFNPTPKKGFCIKIIIAVSANSSRLIKES